MILKTLTIQNFRKFKHASIEFPEGIIGVVGLNGSGKSTIFEAIAWVLYGSVAARTTSENIKRNTAEPSSSCLVALCFQFEGNEYRVVRELKGKTSTATATVTRNGKIAATGTISSSVYIQKTLGMDYKSFYTSIFAKQNELNTLSSMNASERRPLILKMLGIDELDQVIKNINTDKKIKSSLVSHLEKNLIDEQGNEKEKMLYNHEKQLKKQQYQTDEEIKQMKKSLQNSKEKFKTINKEIHDANKTYEQINNNYETAIKQKAQYELNQQLLKEINIIKHKIDNRTNNIEILNKELTQYKNINEDVIKIEKRISDINTSSINFLKQKIKQKTTLNQLERQIDEINQKEKSIKNLGSNATCPTCERELGIQYQFLLKKYKTTHDEIIKDHSRLGKSLQTSTAQHEKLNRELNALQKKKEFLRKKEKKQEQITTKIYSQKNEKLHEEKELKEKQQLQKKTVSIHFDLNKFQILQKKRQTQYEHYQQLINIVDKIKDDLSIQVLEHERKLSHLSLLNQKISSYKKQRDEIKQIIKKVKKEQKKIVELTMLKDIMGSFRLNLISRIQPALSQYASTFFNDLTDGKYPEMTLDDHYNIFIYDDGEKYPIQRFSGGEIDLANLCLRLAISDVITERAEGLFHFIILDEIFGSQDRLRQQNIMEELSKLTSTFKQIFLITHVEHVKNYMQHIIQVEENNDMSILKIN